MFSGIAGNSTSLSVAAFPAFPCVVNPYTCFFVASIKYSAEGSSRFTTPNDGIVIFSPAISFMWS